MNQMLDTMEKIGVDHEILINIDKTTGIRRVATYRSTAKTIADENLEYVNAHSTPAVPRNTFYTRYVKRILDIIISAIAIIISLPINLILGICTYFDVGRPIFFRQTRAGKDGRPFTIVKFRNMNNKCDDNGDLLLAEERVTKFGKFVRKSSLDELLNFWCVFKGDMSIIGPRPLPESYVERYNIRHRARLSVRPGLECPMIHKIDHVASWGEKFDNDVYYVEHVSFALDVKMVFLLFKMVFDSQANSARENGSNGSFMGYDRNGQCINSREVPAEYVKYEVNGESYGKV